MGWEKAKAIQKSTELLKTIAIMDIVPGPFRFGIILANWEWRKPKKKRKKASHQEKSQI